jgi:hypothetical protein
MLSLAKLEGELPAPGVAARDPALPVASRT